MTPSPSVDAARRWLARAEALLASAAPRLNALNVFPVPDADTGSNMHGTLAAARRAAEAEPGRDLGVVLAAAGAAALDAARGNSGTLLAVALAGCAEPLRGVERLSTPVLAAAARAADAAARTALSDPREGTILSVLGAAADSLERAAADADGSCVRPRVAVQRLVEDARRAVEDTESLLEPLTAARVVDAGAVGMLWVLEALRAEVTGTGVDADIAQALHGYAEGPTRPRAARGAPAAGVEVMCTVALAPLDAAGLRRALEAVGEAVILAPVGRTPDAAGRLSWRVHVHVPGVEDALGPLRAAGEPEGVVVTGLDGAGHDEHDHDHDGRHGG